MKIAGFYMTLFLAFSMINAIAQDSWTQRADFGGGVRTGAKGFNIVSKGYIGLGVNDSAAPKDLWEYDSETNAWTQKAFFPGEARKFSLSFSIGSYGFIGTGAGSLGNLHDFWRYDPASNTWEQMAEFPGGSRYHAVGFSIGDKGYIGMGYNDGSKSKKDFWEYDPATDTWTQKAPLPGASRHAAAGFSIGEKGYIGLGLADTDVGYATDLWEYDPLTDSWTKKADFPGGRWTYPVSFSIGSKGYVGTGRDDIPASTNEFWEYDPAADSWTQLADFGGTSRDDAAGFAIGGSGYIGTGEDDADNLFSDFWQFTPGCTTPQDLTATNITGTQAKLQWEAVAGVMGYKLRYKVKNTSAWTVISSPGATKTISALTAGATYTWQVKAICSTGPVVSSEWSAKQEFTTFLRVADGQEVSGFLQVYPNPVHTEATISFSVQEHGLTTLELFDPAGKKVETLLRKNLGAGNHELLLKRGPWKSGLYLLSLRSNHESQVVKIIAE